MFAKELRVEPEVLLERIKSEPRLVFTSSFDEVSVLLVSLEKSADELRRGLTENSTADGSPWLSRSDMTGTGTAAWAPEFKPLSSKPAQAMGYLGFRKVLRKAHFVVQLKKRPRSQLLDDEVISVGRSSMNDIVLRHDSVSKLHGMFERGPDGTFYVRDAGSTNGTRVDGRRLNKHEVEDFREGAEIKFGDIAVRLCQPVVLWDALRKKL